MFVAERAQTGSTQQETFAGLRFEPKPTSGQDPEKVSARKNQNIPLYRAHARNHAISPCANLAGRFTSGATITEDLPAGTLGVDLRGPEALIFAIVPFHKIVVDLRLVAEARQLAGSGGALGAAHIGIFQAFEEHGIKFDVVGGASVGAAVTAAWAFLSSAKELHAAAHDIFVRTRSFKRITYPRYSMLDHTVFDEALKRQYRGYNIEDVWRNYFALSTDLSLNTAHVHRSGPLWRAVRASSSLPGFLPPVYEKGHMLVDGALIDKVPLAMMHQIKSGPNVVVHFGLPVTELFKVEYESIPGRWRLLAGLLSPLHRKRLPVAPGPGNVLLRSLFANQRRDLLPTGPHDLLIEPPPFPDSSFWDWSRHEQISEFAYSWAKAHINELVAEGNSAFAALMEASVSN